MGSLHFQETGNLHVETAKKTGKTQKPNFNFTALEIRIYVWKFASDWPADCSLRWSLNRQTNLLSNVCPTSTYSTVQRSIDSRWPMTLRRRQTQHNPHPKCNRLYLSILALRVWTNQRGACSTSWPIGTHPIHAICHSPQFVPRDAMQSADYAVAK